MARAGGWVVARSGSTLVLPLTQIGYLMTLRVCKMENRPSFPGLSGLTEIKQPMVLMLSISVSNSLIFELTAQQEMKLQVVNE